MSGLCWSMFLFFLYFHDFLSNNLIGYSISFFWLLEAQQASMPRRHLGWHSVLWSTVFKVRLGKVRIVDKYRPLSKDIFCVQGGLLDEEQLLSNVKALQWWGSRDYWGERSIELRMTKTCLFAQKSILACAGALDSLITVFCIVFLSRCSIS